MNIKEKAMKELMETGKFPLDYLKRIGDLNLFALYVMAFGHPVDLMVRA